MSDYIPFDCNEYDKLEILAMHKTAITLLPNPYDSIEPIIITDLIAKDGVEHMHFSNGEKIRLDLIDVIEESIIFLKFDGEEEE